MGGGDATVGRLLICPTPIGNLDDVTVRVLSALAEADVLACEDTRHTRVLLDRHSISARLVSFHEHNERTRTPELLERMRTGATVALVSDAGTPLVADPGYALVRACLLSGIAVEALPGPSAVITALALSGLPVDRWRFVGFLPRRRREIEELLAHAAETLVAFESPRRLPTTLAALSALDPERAVVVCRELTKLHEEVRHGSAADLAGYYREHPPRGEITLVIGRAPAVAAAADEALTAVKELVDAGAKARPAAAVVGRLTGLSANELYRELTRAR